MLECTYLAHPAAAGDPVYPVLCNESEIVNGVFTEKGQDEQDPLRGQDG